MKSGYKCPADCKLHEEELELHESEFIIDKNTGWLIDTKQVCYLLRTIHILTYSYITLLIWDLYFRDLSCESVKYRIIFHRFEVNQRNIGLYFIDLKLYFTDSQLKSRKYRSQISKVM